MNGWSKEKIMDGPQYIQIPDVCRICMAERGNVSIFESNDKESEELLGYSVAERIMSFACVEVQANDDLPDKICLQCLKQIDQAFILKVQCEHADATLRKLCFEDHPADNVICLLSKEESIENPQEASDTSNAFESCDSISQTESAPDLSVFIGKCSNVPNMLGAHAHSSINGTSEDGIAEEKVSCATKEFYDQKINNCDRPTIKILHKSLEQEQTEDVIACAECGEQFSNKKKMEEHGLSQPEHRPFLCELCGKTFKRLSNMKEHEKMHSGVKQFLCSDCGELATGKRYHYCMALYDKAAKGYSCDICGKKFVSRSSLGTHKKRHESGSKFQCKECNKLYFSKQELERHLRVHFNIRPFNCLDENCSLTFYSQGELNRHLRYHEGLRRFSCDKCGQKFFESGHLASHQRKHTGERPYTCRHCPKSFTDSSKLRRHSLAHKKQKMVRNTNVQFADAKIGSGSSRENCSVELEIAVPQEDMKPEYD